MRPDEIAQLLTQYDARIEAAVAKLTSQEAARYGYFAGQFEQVKQAPAELAAALLPELVKGLPDGVAPTEAAPGGPVRPS